MRKVRLSTYLDPQIMKALTAYADRRKQPLSLIAETAIASFLSPDGDEHREAALTKRLDLIDRRLQRLDRDVGINVETMALFISFWLSTTPPPSEDQRALLKRLGSDRYDGFLVALGKRLASGRKLYQDIPEDIFPRKS